MKAELRKVVLSLRTGHSYAHPPSPSRSPSRSNAPTPSISSKRRELIDRLQKRGKGGEEKLGEIRGLQDIRIESGHLGYWMGECGYLQPCSNRVMVNGVAKRLVLTRIDCLDHNSYSQKVEEAEKFIRYSHHPNISTLHSYWVQAPRSAHHYRTVYLLYTEYTVGDLHRCLVLNPLRPSTQTINKYLCDIAKGMGLLHQSGVVHGAIRCTNLFISENNSLVVGPVKRVETEYLREMNHLMSKFNITRFIKLYFVYWAPEIVEGKALTPEADMWALGVVIYLLATGDYPFPVDREDTVFASIRDARVNWRPLLDHSQIHNLVKHLLVLNPAERWTIGQVLSYCQLDSVLLIQKNFRGWRARKHISLIKKSIKKIQAAAKGWLIRRMYQRKRFEVRWQAARLIQKRFRDFRINESLRSVRKIIQFLQARVLSRQVRRAFLKLRKDTISVQAFIRKFLVYSSYRAMNYKKAELPQELAGKSDNLAKFEKLAGLYFPVQKGLREAGLIQPGSQLQVKDTQKEDSIEKARTEIEESLARANKLSSRAEYLPITLISPVNPDLWDIHHQPQNRPSNVLQDDSTYYRNKQPVFEFSLPDPICYLSEVIVYPSEPQPGTVSIFTADSTLLYHPVEIIAKAEVPRRYIFKGDTYAKYIRIHFVNNDRNGYFIGIRLIRVKGIRQQHVYL